MFGVELHFGSVVSERDVSLGIHMNKADADYMSDIHAVAIRSLLLIIVDDVFRGSNCVQKALRSCT
jgi:hypothetical protein